MRLHFLPGAAANVDTYLDDLGLALKQWWQDPTESWTPPVSFLSSSSSLELAAMAWILQLVPNIAARTASFIINQTNTGTGPPVPANVALCLQLHTAGNFRPRFGRVFIPSIAASFLASSGDEGWTGFAASNLAEAFGGLNPYIANGWTNGAAPQLAVWYRSHQAGGPFAMPTAFPVLSVKPIANVVASCYKRIPTRGRGSAHRK